MWRHLKGIERRLRRERPQPTDAFLQRMVGRTQKPRRRIPGRRLGPAVAFAVVAASMLAASGAFAQVGETVAHAVGTSSKIVQAAVTPAATRPAVTIASVNGVVPNAYPPPTVTTSGCGRTGNSRNANCSGGCDSTAGTVTVNFYNGTATTGTPVATVTGSCSGSWSAETGGNPFTVGNQYTAVAQQTDSFGNTGYSTTTFTES